MDQKPAENLVEDCQKCDQLEEGKCTREGGICDVAQIEQFNTGGVLPEVFMSRSQKKRLTFQEVLEDEFLDAPELIDERKEQHEPIDFFKYFNLDLIPLEQAKNALDDLEKSIDTLRAAIRKREEAGE